MKVLESVKILCKIMMGEKEFNILGAFPLSPNGNSCIHIFSTWAFNSFCVPGTN